MANLLTRYDLEKFNWRPFEGEGTPKGCVRRLGGGEQTQRAQNLYFKGLNMGFLALTVDLHDPVSVTKLGSSAQECWYSLRFQFPIIASSIGGSDELPTLTYTTGTPQEIDQWARRTFLVHSPSLIDLEQLRADEGQKKVPSSDGDCVWMHLLPGELADDGTVSRFGLLFHMHHSLSDGVGIRIMMNVYLDQLAKALSGSRSPSEYIQWGNELENLTPPAFSILNSQEAVPIPPDSAQEPSFDNGYYKSLQNILADLDAVTKVTIISLVILRLIHRYEGCTWI